MFFKPPAYSASIVGRPVGRSIGRSVSRSVGPSVRWSVGRSFGRERLKTDTVSDYNQTIPNET